MDGRIINGTWAAAELDLAGAEIYSFYVNLRQADGLMAMRQGGAYRIGAVYGLGRGIDAAVLPLVDWKASSRGDIERALAKVVEEIDDRPLAETV